MKVEGKLRRFFVIALLLIASLVSAHDLFLAAHPFFLETPGRIQIAMNIAEAFPGKEERWRADKTARFWMVGDGITQTYPAKEEKNPTITLPKEGTYVIAWNATDSYIDIEGKEFNEYIEAEGYHNVAALRKQQGKENAGGRERYTRFLKTIAQVGNKFTDDYGKRLGQKLEIIPLQNPYSIKLGAPLPVKLLFDGVPIVGIRMMATYNTYSKEHDVYAHTAETDSNGIANIPLSKKGLWMIRANHMLPLKDDPKADWQSFWTNCTFEVR